MVLEWVILSAFFGLKETIELMKDKIKIINVFNIKTLYIFVRSRSSS